MAPVTPLQRGRARTELPRPRTTGCPSLEQSPCCPPPARVPVPPATRSPSPTRAVLAETLRRPRPWGHHTASSGPPRPRLPPGAEKVLARSLAFARCAEPVRGRGPSVGLRARWARRRGPYKAEECARRGGAGRRAGAALFGLDPRAGGGGGAFPELAGEVIPGGDAGQRWAPSPLIVRGGGFMCAAPSSSVRQAERPGLPVLRPSTHLSPKGPRCLAHARGRASFHQAKYGFFPQSERRRARRSSPSSREGSLVRPLPVWGLPWVLDRRTVLGTAHLSQVTVLSSWPRFPVKWEGGGEDSGKKERPERAK